MLELVKLIGNTYCFSGPVKIGLYKLNDTEVCIIDSGIDKSVGKRILRAIEENGWKLSFIINTHSHADHIGGNAYLQQATGCKIYANKLESSFINFPILESTFLNGANPPKELRGKFLLAEKSECLPIPPDLPSGFEVIDLFGHCFGMIGIRTPDDVLFVADSVSSPETLEKYKLTYILDVGEYLSTLNRLKDIKAKKYVPSHAEICDNLLPIIELNIKMTLEIIEEIVKMCKEPISFDELLKKVFDRYEMVMTAEQNALIGSTVRSYLTYLTDGGRLMAEFENNIKKYRAV